MGQFCWESLAHSDVQADDGMSRKRDTPEQIIGMLREAEVFLPKSGP